MNLFSATGNVGKDPEIRQTQNGNQVASFSLASKAGKDHTNWFRCVAFGKTAEFVSQYVKKGTGLHVIGEVKLDSYEKDGQKVYTTDILVSKVSFTGKKSEAGDTQAAQNPSSANQGNPVDDEIPF